MRMQFRNFIRNRWGFVAGAAIFVFGLPGHKSDADAWMQLAGKMSYPFPEHVSWLLMGAGGILFLVWAYCQVTEQVPTLWKKASVKLTTDEVFADRVGSVVQIILFVAVFAGLIAIFLYGASRSEQTHWTHPTLTHSEQEQAAASCTMDAIGKGLSRWRPEHYHYVEACLISLGFVKKYSEE